MVKRKTYIVSEKGKERAYYAYGGVLWLRSCHFSTLLFLNWEWKFQVHFYIYNQMYAKRPTFRCGHASAKSQILCKFVSFSLPTFTFTIHTPYLLLHLLLLKWPFMTDQLHVNFQNPKPFFSSFSVSLFINFYHGFFLSYLLHASTLLQNFQFPNQNKPTVVYSVSTYVIS